MKVKYGITPQKKIKCPHSHAEVGTMSRWIQKCKAVELLGGCCNQCGNTDIRVLQFDHINNDGALEGRERITGYKVTRAILDNPEFEKRYQVLCANCHAIKTFQFNPRRDICKTF